MNILHKVALQGLKKNRTRTAVTIIGVILSAAMITAVSTFGVSLLDYMAKGAAQRYGGWHLAFLDADPSFARERALDRDVLETVSFENIGYAALEGGKNPNRPYLFIAGFNAETFDALPLTLLSGRLPENSGEVLVSECLDGRRRLLRAGRHTLTRGGKPRAGRRGARTGRPIRGRDGNASAAGRKDLHGGRYLRDARL